MQHYFAYLQSADQKIAVSVCFGMLINKMAVSDETSLISSEVDCMGLSGHVPCRMRLKFGGSDVTMSLYGTN